MNHFRQFLRTAAARIVAANFPAIRWVDLTEILYQSTGESLHYVGLVPSHPKFIDHRGEKACVSGRRPFEMARARRCLPTLELFV